MWQKVAISILFSYLATPVLAASCLQANEGQVLNIEELNCIGFNYIEGQTIEISKGVTQENTGRRFEVNQWAKGRGSPFPSPIGLRNSWKNVPLKDAVIRNLDREQIFLLNQSKSPISNSVSEFFNRTNAAENGLNNRIRNSISSGAVASLYEQIRIHYNVDNCGVYLVKSESCEYWRYTFFGLYLTLKRAQEIFISSNSSFEGDIQKSILNTIAGDEDQARALIVSLLKYLDTNDPAHLNSVQYLIGVLSGTFKPNGDLATNDWDPNKPFLYVNSWRANVALLRSFRSQGDFEGESVTTLAAKRLDQIKFFIEVFFIRADTNAISYFTPQQFYTDLSLLQNYYTSVGEVPAAEAVGVFRANFRASNATLTPSPQDRSVLTKFWGPLTSYGTAIFPLLMAWVGLTLAFGTLMYVSHMSIGFKTRTIRMGSLRSIRFRHPIISIADPSFGGHIECFVDSIYGASQLMILKDYDRYKYKLLKIFLTLASAVFASFVLSYFVTYVSRAL